jgi:hypothetical protein
MGEELLDAVPNAKEFRERTTMGSQGYPEYRRRKESPEAFTFKKQLRRGDGKYVDFEYTNEWYDEDEDADPEPETRVTIREATEALEKLFLFDSQQIEEHKAAKLAFLQEEAQPPSLGNPIRHGPKPPGEPLGTTYRGPPSEGTVSPGSCSLPRDIGVRI